MPNSFFALLLRGSAAATATAMPTATRASDGAPLVYGDPAWRILRSAVNQIPEVFAGPLTAAPAVSAYYARSTLHFSGVRAHSIRTLGRTLRRRPAASSRPTNRASSSRAAASSAAAAR
jgi:hypothetical protein